MFYNIKSTVQFVLMLDAVLADPLTRQGPLLITICHPFGETPYDVNTETRVSHVLDTSENVPKYRPLKPAMIRCLPPLHKQELSHSNHPPTLDIWPARKLSMEEPG